MSKILAACTRGWLIALGLGLLVGGSWGAEPEKQAPQLVHLEPGLVVGEKAPQPWTHLVIKSIPRLMAGDLESLPASASTTATLFRTVVLAEVGPARKGPSRFELRRVGVGLCMPDSGGLDRVVSVHQVSTANLPMSQIEKVVLVAAERRLRRGRLAAATSSFALYQGPAEMLVGSSHREVDVCYGIRLDVMSGELETVYWCQSNELRDVRSLRRLIVLPPDLVCSCPIDVKARRIFGRLPVSWSFAMHSYPPGRTIGSESTLGPLLEESLKPKPDGARLERELVRLVSEKGP